jgi:hypothetical protein
MPNDTHCRCVFPLPTEQELATIPGDRPGTALRVQVETGQEGYVRLEQLAFDAGLGWYVQKSFTIPGEALAALVPQLRKADCLIPRRRTTSGQDAYQLFPTPNLRLVQPPAAERREA